MTLFKKPKTFFCLSPLLRASNQHKGIVPKQSTFFLKNFSIQIASPTLKWFTPSLNRVNTCSPALGDFCGTGFCPLGRLSSQGSIIKFFAIFSFLLLRMFFFIFLWANKQISPVHLVWDLESLPLIQSLYFFQKMSKKLQVLVDPIVVIFLEMKKFSFPKKFTTTGSTNTCIFFTFD